MTTIPTVDVTLVASSEVNGLPTHAFTVDGIPWGISLTDATGCECTIAGVGVLRCPSTEQAALTIRALALLERVMDAEDSERE